MADCRKTLLVVEDNPINMKLIRCVLSLHDYRILEARDAETGIELAHRHRPDLILMDIKLPGMDGLSATAIIRRNPDLSGVPIVAVTSYAMLGDAERAIKAGCTEYMTKPINTRTLVNTVGRLLKTAGLKIGSAPKARVCQLGSAG